MHHGAAATQGGRLYLTDPGASQAGGGPGGV